MVVAGKTLFGRDVLVFIGIAGISTQIAFRVSEVFFWAD